MFFSFLFVFLVLIQSLPLAFRNPTSLCFKAQVAPRLFPFQPQRAVLPRNFFLYIFEKWCDQLFLILRFDSDHFVFGSGTKNGQGSILRAGARKVGFSSGVFAKCTICISK